MKTTKYEIKDIKVVDGNRIFVSGPDCSVVHILPRGEDGWAVKREGTNRALAVKSTKKEAIKIAKEYKKNNNVSRIVVHNVDGRFSKSKVL